MKRVSVTTGALSCSVKVLPDGSPGSPGRSVIHRRPSRQSSQLTRSHSKPTETRKKSRMTHLDTDKNTPEHTCNPRICRCTLRRSSCSEKLTPSWDTESPLLPFVETGEADRFWRDADMNKRQQVGQGSYFSVLKLPVIKEWAHHTC